MPVKKPKSVLPKLEIPEIKEEIPKLERKDTLEVEKPEPKGKGKGKKNKQ
jgi:hypothetical protein